MPVMTDLNRSVAANTVVDNVLAGKLDEFLRIDSVVTLHAVAQAVGVKVTLIVGGEVAIDNQEIIARAGATSIIIPDDFVVSSAGFNGDRIILRIANTTGAAIIVMSRLETSPA